MELLGIAWPAESLARLAIAAVAGALVGVEREIRGREAGFRTNLLVAVGSALVMLVSMSMSTLSWPHSPNFNIVVDPARIAYGVMTGIGFLGAGAILKQNGSIRGLTTAAALWCVAAIGLAAGQGQYLLVLYATAIVVVALWGLDYAEHVLPRRQYRKVVVRCRWEAGCVAGAVDWFKQERMEVSTVYFRRVGTDLAEVDITMEVAFASKQRFHQIEQRLIGHPNMQLMATESL